MRTLEVKTCSGDCPLFDGEWTLCNHPDWTDGNDVSDELDADDCPVYCNGRPQLCPLNKEPILIKAK